MEFLQCPDCAGLHNDPADANLGLLVRCMQCELSADVESYREIDAREDHVPVAA